jgi:putative sterol carrier protein
MDKESGKNKENITENDREKDSSTAAITSDDAEDEVITLNVDQGAAQAGEFEDVDDSELEEVRRKQAEQEKAMRRPTNAREVLTQFVPNRSERGEEKLRSHLVGKIAIDIDGPNENYLFEWKSGRATVKEEKASAADCTIRLSEQNLMKVVAGELNPQVAMLSGKIRVQGSAEAAIYFFNLVAPRAHH